MGIQLEFPWTIICEGHADKAFFLKLIHDRKLPNFDVPFPTNESGGGRSAFAQMLRGLRVASNYKKLDAILIVSDNDDNPKRSFSEVQKQIKIAKGYPIPEAPMQIAKVEGQPAIFVLMLPWIDKPGCLESLYLEVFMREQKTMMRCVDDFIKCASVASWKEVQKRDKASFQCFIAGTNKEDPNKSLRRLLEKHNHKFNHTFPVTSPEFDEIASILHNFKTILE